MQIRYRALEETCIGITTKKSRIARLLARHRRASDRYAKVREGTRDKRTRR